MRRHIIIKHPDRMSEFQERQDVSTCERRQGVRKIISPVLQNEGSDEENGQELNKLLNPIIGVVETVNEGTDNVEECVPKEGSHEAPMHVPSLKTMDDSLVQQSTMSECQTLPGRMEEETDDIEQDVIGNADSVSSDEPVLVTVGSGTGELLGLQHDDPYAHRDQCEHGVDVPIHIHRRKEVIYPDGTRTVHTEVQVFCTECPPPRMTWQVCWEKE